MLVALGDVDYESHVGEHEDLLRVVAVASDLAQITTHVGRRLRLCCGALGEASPVDSISERHFLTGGQDGVATVPDEVPEAVDGRPAAVQIVSVGVSRFLLGFDRWPRASRSAVEELRVALGRDETLVDDVAHELLGDRPAVP